MKRLVDNLIKVQERIAEAAKRSGRTSDAISLIGVTKYVNAEISRALFEAGCVDLGESRPQQLWEKAQAMSDIPVRWHMIGHLQRNKIKKTVPLVSVIHSGDSLRMLRDLPSVATPPKVLIEVNISGDASKHGFSPEEIEANWVEIQSIEHLKIAGLMAMAGLQSNQDEVRRQFAAVRDLRDRLAASAAAKFALNDLSMGMSHDYEIAIEEGATMVRVGSALFEGIEL